MSIFDPMINNVLARRAQPLPVVGAPPAPPQPFPISGAPGMPLQGVPPYGSPMRSPMPGGFVDPMRSPMPVQGGAPQLGAPLTQPQQSPLMQNALLARMQQQPMRQQRPLV